MVDRNDTGQSGPMKLIFNYNNVFYSFYYDDVSGCVLPDVYASFFARYVRQAGSA